MCASKLAQIKSITSPMTSSHWKFISAISSWWNPANYSDAKMAETKLINHYINEDLFNIKINDLHINYNHKSNTSQQFIHTLSLNIQPNSLQSLQKMKTTRSSFTDTKLENSQNFESKITNQSSCSNGNSLLTLQQIITLKHKNHQTSNSKTSPIILAHGYGCGGAVFLPSINTIYSTLSKYHNNQYNISHIHIIDWLGNGLSSRPVFNCRNTSETETFFVDSLEEWRKSMNIKKMILCAHSLGAYSSILYALKYPQYIDHLILISPVGMPEKPKEWDERFNNRKVSWKVKLLIQFFTMLWEWGYTPNDILRYMGPNGKAFLSFIVDKRLFRLNDDSYDTKILKELLSEYLYHILAMNGKGSGEYALNKILMPGAWAYNPLCNRINGLKELQKEYGFDIDFVYGENDWMRSENALKLKEDGSIDCNVYVVNDCGHQMLLENAIGFGEMLAMVIVKGQLQ
eukprot:490787_1